MSERWVINASPVLLLAKAGVVDLLPRVCVELVVPSSVVTEVLGGTQGDTGRLWLSGRGARFVVEPPLIPSQLRDAELGRGETEVLAWALANPGFKVVLDDRQGRHWATRLSLRLLGSLGVAVVLKRKGLIPLARPVLEKIASAGGFVSAEAIRAALLEAGET